MAKLIIGCGYLGRRAASLWLGQGHEVWALTRGRADELRALGIRPVVGDVRERLDVSALKPADTVLYAVAPDRRSDQTPEEVWLSGPAHLTAVAQTWPTRPRLIFISSTSVYGQSGGAEVDESAPTDPAEESGRVLLAAERFLHGGDWTGAVVLRLAGIYGPGRLIRSQSLLKGETIPADPDGWLNLIHVEDAAAAVVAADERARPGGIYNIADGWPVRRRDFYTRLAELIGAPPPRFAPPAADAANRRVSNRGMREELGVVPRYPSYEEGLAASV